jgi:murein DD-endopeptidase MepM/ murein hydrolase activator NlpD
VASDVEAGVGVAEHTKETTSSRGRSRRVMVFVALLSTVSLAIGARSSGPALAQVTDPTTTTTAPAPDTTTTTAPAPDTTTTTQPAADPTTTTTPTTDTTTTTEPATEPTTTTLPSATDLLTEFGTRPGNLAPAEALVPRPEFGALTDYQRALVQQLQTATDGYALRRFAVFDIAHEVATAKDVLALARAAENAAARREVFGLADATNSCDDVAPPAVCAPDAPEVGGIALAATRVHSHLAGLPDRVAAIRVLSGYLDGDRQKSQRTRVQVQASLAALNARLAAETKELAREWGERSATESAIEQELGSGAVRARPDGITATLSAVQAGQPAPIVVNGIGQPIPGAALVSPFGLRNDPLSDGAGFHPGIDLAAESGTPIHAAAAGVVVTAGDCGGYGNCVVIDHGDSLATVYAHQSEVLVQVGQHVDAGEIVGLVGSTGLATGPHLHFEVRLRGLPIDPVLALTD